MIDLHYWPTPNGWKISIMLEECGLPYTLKPVNIGRGEQFKPEFLAISPNNRMPAIVDHDPPGGGAPVSVFESGAILIYLAEKTGRFLPTDLRSRKATLAMADVADGRPGADGRAERPLPALCAGEDSLRDRALRQGGQPPVRRARPAAAAHRRLRRRRRLFDRRHGHLPVGAHLEGAAGAAGRLCPRQGLARCDAAAPCGAPRHRRRQGTARQRPGRRGAQGAVRPDRADAARRRHKTP